MTDEIRRSRSAFLWVGVIVPLAIILLATAVIIVWTPQLPDPVATHWGDGGADGFGPAWSYVALTLGFGGGMVALFGATALFAPRLPRSSTSAPVGPWGPTTRFLAGMSLGMAVMVAVVSLAGAGVQRGLADAVDAPDIGGWALLGLALLVACTALGWFVQPKSPIVQPARGVAEGIALTPTERAAWFGTAAMARAGIALLLISVLVLALLTVVLLAQGASAWWILALFTVLLAVLIATMLVFRVRVDARGLRVRSAAGWPRTAIALDRIERIEIVEVDPLREFGGWGWRISVDGRRGVVLRAGEALQVTHRGGRTFVVTVDGAADAAAVLEGLRTAAEEH